jgi:hypothetical protein
MPKTKRHSHTRLRRKTRKYYRRNQRGGGKEQQGDFLFAFNTHKDMQRIGREKPVATPFSMGGDADFQKFIRLWAALTPEDIVSINDKFRHAKGFTINAHITPSSATTANPIIFYSVEHLGVLARAAEYSVEDVLRLITTRGEKTDDEMDIIQVAFNDKAYGIPLSESGNLLYAKYISLLP